jgi:hypothetical protein
LPRLDRASREGFGTVRNGEIVVDADDATKTFAGRARADGMVEAEERRDRLAVIKITPGAVEAGTEVER